MVRRTILIVEDEPVLLRYLDRMFTARGWRCVTACSGRAALAIAQTSRPDCALIDFHLPDTDGLKVLADLRTHSHTRTLPTTIMSADLGLSPSTCAEVGRLGGRLLLGISDFDGYLRAAEEMVIEGQLSTATLGDRES